MRTSLPTVSPLLLVLAASASLGSAALAQPKLVITAVSSDMSANGTCATGWVYDGVIGEYAPFIYRRGTGFQRITGQAPGVGGEVSISGDGTVLGAAMDNTADWGALNCFAGYDASGSPKVVQNPCSSPLPAIAHRYTAAGGWVNAGSLPRFADPVTGRMIGGTRCDYTINSVYDLSADGRYIVGGAYSTRATNNAGNPSLGFCGDFFAFRYDGQTGQLEKLPTTSTTTRADRVSGDGSVVTGYDLGAVNDGAGGTYSSRRLSVWVGGAAGTQTILDTGGNQDMAPVNGPGTVVAAGASRYFCQTNFGSNTMRLVKWTRSGSSWTPQNLGRPTDRYDEWGTPFICNGIAAYGVSDDGNTIVGEAFYAGSEGQLNGTPRPFIWRPTINGGVPMDLEDYLLTLDPSGAATAGASITYVTGLSADGNTLFVRGDDAREFCEVGQTLSAFFVGMLSLNGAAVGNEPPSIAMQPVDMATRCEWAGWGEPVNVTAGGSWPLNYQWQREDPSNPGSWTGLASACSASEGTDFPHDSSWEFEGVNGPQLRINVVGQGGGHDGRYRVVVSNAYGSVTSQPATFTFLPPLSPLDPVDTVACLGSPATFTVGPVTGLGECRWEVCLDEANGTWAILTDGDNLLSIGSVRVQGAFTPTATVTPLTLPAGGQFLFRCHVADSCNLLDTNPATLTVGSQCGLADLGTQGGVPITCGDGRLDNNDFITFITFFFNGNPLADQGIQGGLPGHDGLFNNNDFIAFINNFFNGCNH